MVDGRFSLTYTPGCFGACFRRQYVEKVVFAAAVQLVSLRRASIGAAIFIGDIPHTGTVKKHVTKLGPC